jgi:hypothetical protein
MRLPRRPRHVAIFAAALLGFLAISFQLARYLSTETHERDEVFALLRAQAQGDAAAMLGRLGGCARHRACRARVVDNARSLRRPGQVKILAYDSQTAYALGAATGQTRVAWTVVDRGLPVVQCVLVRRSGNALAGRSVTLLRLSAPIGRQGSC